MAQGSSSMRRGSVGIRGAYMSVSGRLDRYIGQCLTFHLMV